MGNKGLDYTALVITVIGAINWGAYRSVPIGPGSADIRPDELDFQNRICDCGYLRHLSAHLLRPCWKRQR